MTRNEDGETGGQIKALSLYLSISLSLCLSVPLFLCLFLESELEVESRFDLDVARPKPRAGDLAEEREVGDVRIWISSPRAVERVKEVCADFEVFRLGEREALL